MSQQAAEVPPTTKPIIKPSRRPPEPCKPPSWHSEDAVATGPQGFDEQADALVDLMLAKAREADDPEQEMLAQLFQMDSLAGSSDGIGAAGDASWCAGAAQLNSRGFPIRPGKEVCSFFMRTGNCRFGSNCVKDHPETGCWTGPSAVATVQLNSSGFPIRPGMELCTFYVRTGNCKFGSKCVKHHPEMHAPGAELSDMVRQQLGVRHRTEPSQAVQLNSSGFPIRPGKEQCAFYMRTGTCKFGSKCVKDHPEMNAVETPPNDTLEENQAYSLHQLLTKAAGDADLFDQLLSEEGGGEQEQSSSSVEGHDNSYWQKHQDTGENHQDTSDWDRSDWKDSGSQSGQQGNWQEWENKGRGLDYEVTYNDNKTEAKLWLTMDGFKHAHLSRVIGKRGSNLVWLGKESGAKVHLCGKDSNRPTEEDNHLLIRSPQAAAVQKAIQLAETVLVDVLEFGFPICSRCGQAHKDRDCPNAALDYSEKIFLDPKVKVGFVIGSGGRNVQPIKDRTGALIRVCGVGSGVSNSENEPLHVCVECKTQSQLDDAVAMMNSLIDSVKNYSPYDDKPPEGHVFKHHLKIHLDAVDLPVYDDGLNAHIFGKGGQNLKKIRDLTGAWVWLRGNGSGVDDKSSEPLHILIEHDDEFLLEEAKKLVLELLDSVYEKVRTNRCKLCGGPHFEYRCTKANSVGYQKDLEAKGCGKDIWQDYIPGKRDAEIIEAELPSSKYQKLNPSPYEWPVT